MGGRLGPNYTATARIQMAAPPDVDITYSQGVRTRTLRDDMTAARANFLQAAFSPEVRNRTLRSIGLANADFAYVALGAACARVQLH
jgi:hypothetical protein